MSETIAIPEIKGVPSRVHEKLVTLAKQSEAIGPRVEYQGLRAFAEMQNILHKRGVLPDAHAALHPVAEKVAQGARVGGGAIDVGLKAPGFVSVLLGLGGMALGGVTVEPPLMKLGAVAFVGGLVAMADPIRHSEILAFQTGAGVVKGADKIVDKLTGKN
jgi:hypothetical protein